MYTVGHTTASKSKNMSNNKIKHRQKVVYLEGRRSKKQLQASVVAILQDTRAAARAIQDKTCLLCGSRKLCVNRTGLCAACYGTIKPYEKKVADSEAAHKIITVTVTDDRWNEGKE
mgnify:CR=1 FL=1